MKNSDPDHERASRIFLKAVDLEPDARTAYLDEACRGEPELRAEVESLDRKASRLGVPRQSLIKMLIARHLTEHSAR